MAGDWIKVETELPDKPEVQYIAGILNIDPDAVVGKLFRVWAWFDKHTESGNALGVTHLFLDRITNVSGFAEAMALAGWLKQNGNSLTIPRFERHSGKTAKNRALTNERVAKSRNLKRSSNDECNAESNGVSVTKTVTREEKRRSKDIARTRATQIPTDFIISPRVSAWASEKGHTDLAARFEHFVSYAKRSGKVYVDWDEALMGAIREDWAKLGSSNVTALPRRVAV